MENCGTTGSDATTTGTETTESPRRTLTERLGAVAEPPLILDGGSGTELERLAGGLPGGLWSAALLDTRPELITKLHRAYLAAGADIIESVSYQASIPGLIAAGHSPGRAAELLSLSWTLADDAARAHPRGDGRQVLAASAIGPFGAFLADGSEYSGDYRGASGGTVTTARLTDFHTERIAVLHAAGCRLFAVETIPRADEALAIAEIMRSYPDTEWWLALSTRRGAPAPALADGTPLADLLTELPSDARAPVAVGVNCCPPATVIPAVLQIRAAGRVPLAYPNLGGTYSAATGEWTDDPDDFRAGTPHDPPAANVSSGARDSAFALESAAWAGAGARLIGGCCRTTPATTREMARANHTAAVSSG